MQYWLLRVYYTKQIWYSAYMLIYVLIQCRYLSDSSIDFMYILFNFGDLDLTCPHLTLCWAVIKTSPTCLEPKMSASLIVWTSEDQIEFSSNSSSSESQIPLVSSWKFQAGVLEEGWMWQNGALLLSYMIQAAQKVSSHPDVTLLM